jgi:signal peptidase I
MIRWAEHLLATIGFCFIIYHFCFELTVMTSDSMAPTLKGTSYENGDRILLEKVSGRFRAPKRWEIYFYYDTDGTPVAKRVVGLPGERIAINTNGLCINGTPLSRPKGLEQVSYYGYGNLANGREVECGKGYFMLGDSTKDSYDSRFTGPVAKQRFRGRIWCIVSPRSHIGFVK